MTTALIITQSASILVIAILLIWRRARTKIVRQQDQDLLKLNLTIQDKDKFIVELITKYGLTTEATEIKQSFKQRLDELHKKQNINKLNNEI